MAGGKPKLNSINGLLVWVETFHQPEFNVKEGLTPPKIFLKSFVPV